MTSHDFVLFFMDVSLITMLGAFILVILGGFVIGAIYGIKVFIKHLREMEKNKWK